MKPNEVVSIIIELSEDRTIGFPDKADQLKAQLDDCSTEVILEHLDCAGVIPECFNHDSTEEKLFAKYCDALLATSLAELGLESEVISERSGAADVRAKGINYQLVGDAKAFRLSRTAKNQKDFKVEALNQWRGGADYACLVGPYYQYPNTNSQIYSQAIRYNVTLLSYTHIGFMIRNLGDSPKNLLGLWQTGERLKNTKGISQSANSYWAELLDTMLNITGKNNEDWEQAVEATRQGLREQGKQQVEYWENVKKNIADLDHRTAVKQLIKALKIDAKINVVRRASGL